MARGRAVRYILVDASTLVERTCRPRNRTLTDEQHQRLAKYLDLLLDGNQQMNLTRIVDRESAEVQHVGDALTLLKFIPVESRRIADVGSGGGVPGLPLAIAMPEVSSCSLNPPKKRRRSWIGRSRSWAVQRSRLRSARRGCRVGTRHFAETFDVAVARAVGTMNWLAEWCLPLVRKRGVLLAMKGPKAAEELPLAEHAIQFLGGSSPDVHPADLPGASQHVIVQIRKIGKTPANYPRAGDGDQRQATITD